MLALLEHQVTKAGGAYAFCDTDSLAIVATPRGRRDRGRRRASSVTALSWATVRRILDRFERTQPLQPRAGSRARHGVSSSTAFPPSCGAMRSAPSDMPSTGSIRARRELVGRSRPARRGREVRGGSCRRRVRGLVGARTRPLSRPHRHRSRRAVPRRAGPATLGERRPGSGSSTMLTGEAHDYPEWGGRFAVTRFTLSGPRTAEWFAGYNATRPLRERIRPGSFGLIAHPATGFPGQPAAPYERDPNQWPTLPWYDRATGHEMAVAREASLRGEAAELLASGTVPIQTVGDVIHRYRLRPEHKSLSPDGNTGPARHRWRPQAKADRIHACSPNPLRQGGQQAPRTTQRRGRRPCRLPRRLRSPRRYVGLSRCSDQASRGCIGRAPERPAPQNDRTSTPPRWRRQHTASGQPSENRSRCCGRSRRTAQ